MCIYNSQHSVHRHFLKLRMYLLTVPLLHRVQRFKAHSNCDIMSSKSFHSFIQSQFSPQNSLLSQLRFPLMFIVIIFPLLQCMKQRRLKKSQSKEPLISGALTGRTPPQPQVDLCLSDVSMASSPLAPLRRLRTSVTRFIDRRLHR